MWWDALYISYLLGLAHFCHAEVYSCVGYVRSAGIALDYSSIQVKLFTAEGNLKYETDCNPSNGYYLLPLYNKGSYYIRVVAPEGWFFEPDAVNVKFDGKTDNCSRGIDINFVLSSFAVEGVLRSGEGDGPSGVKLALLSEDGKVVLKNQTTTNGIYRFRAPPGRYMVSTADDSAECIERGMVSTEVVDSPVRVSPDLKISGHLLSVFITSDKQPLSDVAVSLYSQNDVKLSYCDNSKVETVMTKQSYGKKFCTLRTNVNGIAKFPCLPPGKYVVVPTLSTSKVEFSFSPEITELVMQSKAEKLSFSMRGFTSRGRVLLGQKPVVGADILIDGALKAKTDIEGWYSVDGLREDRYSLTVAADHLSFATVSVRLTVDKPELPDLTVDRVELCGNVDVSEGTSPVMTINLKTKRTNEVQSVKSGSDGKFCKFLSPEEYIISISSDITVVMTPKEKLVDLSKGPVLNVVFTQFMAKLSGKVFCLDRCGKLKLELWSGSNMIKRVEGSDSFHFENVTPDTYKLKLIDQDQYCWEKSELDVVVERSDVNNIEFHQNGYRVSIITSHPAKLKWNLHDKKQLNGQLNVSGGQTNFCVPVTGRYDVTLSACHVYDKPVYDLLVPQEAPLTATATKFLLTASIISNDATLKADQLSMKVQTASNEFRLPVSSSEGTKFEFVFYISASDHDSTVVLTPLSSTHLFEPSSFTFKFQGVCILDVTSFVADKGVFIEGQVVPAVENVKIISTHKADKKLSLKTVTDPAGKFRLGPVRKAADFEISAEKHGYKFEPSNKFAVLRAIKLSELVISTVDEISQQPLSGVLLSLSGVDNYRSNNIIDESGVIKFVGLKPGEYFIRPILQEYKFEPPSSVVTIEEGETQNIVVNGKRFAYSVYGKVTQLAGQPVSSMLVEAVSEQCSNLQEEDTTSDKGEYRIRGLHPKCLYRVLLKAADGTIIESYPSHYDLTVEASDLTDVDFVLTHMDDQLEVIGDVEFVGIQPPSQYRVGLYRGETAVQHVVVNSPSSVFFFGNLTIDNTEYVIRFETVHGHGGQRYDASEVAFIANKSFKAAKIVVRPLRKSSDVEITSGNYLALPFFFIIALLFFNHEKAVSLVDSIFHRFANLAASYRNPLPSDEHYPDPTRKRQKPKKA
ncbi:hypothetical protein AB6A40_000976 [Gnathostoma spinigerum]|uniref:Nodal modulator 1 n=1 Tax=Gnathostoma spinigerum TaxID=75299 RepID=A0ABD6EC50_9BILA